MDWKIKMPLNSVQGEIPGILLNLTLFRSEPSIREAAMEGILFELRTLVFLNLPNCMPSAGGSGSLGDELGQ